MDPWSMPCARTRLRRLARLEHRKARQRNSLLLIAKSQLLLQAPVAFCHLSLLQATSSQFSTLERIH